MFPHKCVNDFSLPQNVGNLAAEEDATSLGFAESVDDDVSDLR